MITPVCRLAPAWGSQILSTPSPQIQSNCRRLGAMLGSVLVAGEAGRNLCKFGVLPAGNVWGVDPLPPPPPGYALSGIVCSNFSGIKSNSFDLRLNGEFVGYYDGEVTTQLFFNAYLPLGMTFELTATFTDPIPWAEYAFIDISVDGVDVFHIETVVHDVAPTVILGTFNT